MKRHVAGAVIAMALPIVALGSTDAAGPAGTTTLPATSTTAPPAPTPPTTTILATTAPPTTTTVPPPVDLLAGVNWLQNRFPSPCGDGDVDLTGGTTIVGGQRVVLDDIRPLNHGGGLAVAFLSCHPTDGVVGARNVAVVVAGPNHTTSTRAERPLPAGARVVDVDLPEITIETPEGASPPAGCCPPFVRRQVVTVAADEITITDDGLVPAFAQTLPGGLGPVVGTNAALVQASLPATAALCYRWGDPAMYPQDPPDVPEPPTAPSAELATLRLALIAVTGQWIDPASEMTADMADVVRSYQAARGLDVDGVVGRQTGSALAADLGCPPTVGAFHQVDPPTLGPRRFRSATELAGAMWRFAVTGHSGSVPLDALLAASGWNGANSLFLGCNRRESPRAGLTCSWSGDTPLQLVGLVDDPSTEGVTPFSILYARTAATL